MKLKMCLASWRQAGSRTTNHLRGLRLHHLQLFFIVIDLLLDFFELFKFLVRLVKT